MSATNSIFLKMNVERMASALYEIACCLPSEYANDVITIFKIFNQIFFTFFCMSRKLSKVQNIKKIYAIN